MQVLMIQDSIALSVFGDMLKVLKLLTPYILGLPSTELDFATGCVDVVNIPGVWPPNHVDSCVELHQVFVPVLQPVERVCQGGLHREVLRKCRGVG